MPKRALIVIDVQNIYTNPKSEMYSSDSRKTVERINELVRDFKTRNEPIIYVRHAHKPDGSDAGRLFDYSGEEEDLGFIEGTEEVKFDNRLVLDPAAPVITKNRYSAFKNTELDILLKRLSVERVVICGFMTNFCCESTAREALDMDYFVDFVIDATGTPGTDGMQEAEIRRAVGDMLSAGIARVFKTARYLKGR